MAPASGERPQRYYFVVGVSPRGRYGPPTPLVPVPLGPTSSAPPAPEVTVSEKTMAIRWQRAGRCAWGAEPTPPDVLPSRPVAPSPPPTTYDVYEVPRAPAPANATPVTPTPLTPAPVGALEFAQRGRHAWHGALLCRAPGRHPGRNPRARSRIAGRVCVVCRHVCAGASRRSRRRCRVGQHQPDLESQREPLTLPAISCCAAKAPVRHSAADAGPCRRDDLHRYERPPPVRATFTPSSPSTKRAIAVRSRTGWRRRGENEFPVPSSQRSAQRGLGWRSRKQRPDTGN